MEKIIFEDLPSTKTPLNAENLNQIQINAQNSINEVDNKFNYSTEEQLIGTWINGKPLYRKTISGVISAGANVVDSTINSKTNSLVKVEGKTKSGEYQYSVPWYENTNDFINFSLISTGFRIHVGSNNANRTYEITIYYTKTTD